MISNAVSDLETVIDEYSFPEVPQDPPELSQEASEDIKDNFIDSFEGEAEQINAYVEPALSKEPSSCEEITETEPIDDGVDISASLSEECPSNVQNEVHQDVCSPSAPFSGGALLHFDYYSQDMYSKRENKICYPDLISQIALNVTQHRNNVEKLKPFSETEMSAYYYNQELHNFDVFVDNFVEMELKSGNVVRHPLHELLMEYLKCRDNLCKNGLEFESLIENYKKYQEKIWNFDTSSYTEYGECQVLKIYGKFIFEIIF